MNKILLAILISYFIVTPCSATVLTFDDLPISTTSIPDGYGGFSWNNSALNSESIAVVSGSQCVSGWQGGDWPNYWWSITSVSSFNFSGAFFTGVYPGVGDLITIKAYNNGELVGMNRYAINLSPTWVAADFGNIDKIEIISFDGFPIYMDNFTYNITPIPNPEPSTIVLFGTGLLGAAFLRKIIKRVCRIN